MPSPRILSPETIEILIEAIDGQIEDRGIASTDVPALAGLFNSRQELVKLRDRGTTTRKPVKPRAPRATTSGSPEPISINREAFPKP